jgi:uncharacterized protein YbbK (DUF523 family)
VSACLLGHAVRYDGHHKRDAFLVEVVAPLAELVPICPEVEVGLGVPRPTLHLEDDGAHVRVRVTTMGEDVTERLEAWSDGRVRELDAAGLDGAVLKARSPSCGTAGVALLRAGAGASVPEGVGLFAAALRAALPELPVEDEAGLADPDRRREFFARVVARAERRGASVTPLFRSLATACVVECRNS